MGEDERGWESEGGRRRIGQGNLFKHEIPLVLVLIHVSHYQQVLRVHEISLFSIDLSFFLLLFPSGSQWFPTGESPVMPQ